jgi:hypothetical protein
MNHAARGVFFGICITSVQNLAHTVGKCNNMLAYRLLTITCFYEIFKRFSKVDIFLVIENYETWLAWERWEIGKIRVPVPVLVLTQIARFPLDYVGCYRDDKEKGRDLPFRPQSRTHNRGDALSCVLNCAESGFIYAGLQNGNLCFCGNKYGRYGRVSDKHCNLKCLKPIGVQIQSTTDDVFNSCGGKWVNSVYSGIYIHACTHCW